PLSHFRTPRGGDRGHNHASRVHTREPQPDLDVDGRRVHALAMIGLLELPTLVAKTENPAVCGSIARQDRPPGRPTRVGRELLRREARRPCAELHARLTWP